MMDALVSSLTPIITDVLVALLVALAGYLTKKAAPVLDRAKKLREIQIIDKITDDLVEFAEAEFTGQKGKVKRELVADKAAEVLLTKNIKLSRDELLAAIENSVRKLVK